MPVEFLIGGSRVDRLYTDKNGVLTLEMPLYSLSGEIQIKVSDDGIDYYPIGIANGQYTIDYANSDEIFIGLRAPTEYVVTFDPQNGESSFDVITSGVLNTPEDPVWEGYVFAGWFKEPACINRFDFSEWITDDMILYGKWAEEPLAYYMLMFDVDGGSFVESQLTTGAVRAPSIIPTKEGYSFAGWFEDKSCTVVFDFSKEIKQDTVAYAKWEQNERFYMLMFDVDGGSFIETQLTTGAVSRPTDPTKPGFIFAGWYTNSAYENLFDFSDAITQNTVIYARWTESVVPIEYIVMFDTQGGSFVPSQRTSGKVTAPDVPTKDGYRFTGWYVDRQGTQLFHFETDTVNQDIVLYAVWEEVAGSGETSQQNWMLLFVLIGVLYSIIIIISIMVVRISKKKRNN